MSEIEFSGMPRRKFLQTAAIAGGGLALGFFRIADAMAADLGAAGHRILYKDFGDVYRKAWTWDKVVKSTHTRANCISACSWDIYVKHGIAWREEQNAVYTAPRPDVPDMNPRGCQKGACYSDLQVDGGRILHPLKRVGKRGEGKWKRISWDDALTEMADKLIDIAVEDGTEAIVHDHGTTNIGIGPETMGEFRFIEAMQVTAIDSYAGVSDMPMGAVQTMGMYACEGTSDDWFRSDYIVVWIGNPTYTRIPEAHFMNEARYKGAKLVVIAPDLNASAIHADLWINPKMETDSAFALAAAKVIIDENLYKRDHVVEQTDLPILVRSDTGRFLRESDLKDDGKDNIFYFWDEATGAIAEVPGCEGNEDKKGNSFLRLNAIKPALDGDFSVRGKDGAAIRATTVFRRLKDHLDRDYTLEKAAQITGIHPSVIQRFAREFSAAKAAMIFASWGACKLHHSDLMQRAMILLTALTGQQGKPGSGMRIAAWWGIPEWVTALTNSENAKLPPADEADMNRRWTREGGPTVRDISHVMKAYTRISNYVPMIPFLYVHGGYDKMWGRQDLADPALPRPLADYMRDSIKNGWTPMHPPVGKKPRALIFTGSNPLRRWPAPQIAEEHLWPKLELIVTVDFRMSTTGMKADLFLPAAGYYEKLGIKYPQSYLHWLVFSDQCVKPLGDSKSEWFIFGLLTQRISERAKQRGIGKVNSSHARGTEIDLAHVYDNWSANGTLDPTDPLSDRKEMANFMKRNAKALATHSVDQALKDGIVRYKGEGMMVNAEWTTCSDYKDNDTLTPYEWQVQQKRTWPTLTGRQQFLIDHEWYVEAGETLPMHKDSPGSNIKWPLRVSGGHTRWSIHAIWRSSTLLLRLQRGEPVCFMHPKDCSKRGIEDGDYAKVFNDVGDYEVMVKVSPSAQPGEVIIYHAWEPYQFKGWKSDQQAIASPWKAIHLAGGYCHLQYHTYYAAPSFAPRGNRVQVALARPGSREGNKRAAQMIPIAQV